VVGQGAYYAAGQWLVTGVLLAALVAALWVHWLSRADLRLAVLAACAALATWTVLRAALAGDAVDAGPTVAMLGGLAIVLLVGRRLTRPQRKAVAAAMVAIGVLAALTGWVGVAWHVRPWAIIDQALWRAATTLTYANAAAGLLAPLALVAVAQLAARPRSALAAMSTCLLLVGVAATLSRGGALALLGGAAVLVWLLGPRPVLRAATAPVVGAAIALAGLVPSMPANGPAQPALAVGALAVGLAVAAGLARLSGRARVGALVIIAGVAAAMLLQVGPITQAAHSIGGPRLTVVSADRAGALGAGLRLAGNHPLIGVGPGQASFIWTTADGRTVIGRYAHNEYLQVLVELGVIGFLLLVLLTAIARTVWQGRAATPSPAAWAAVAAGLVALALHSALDFLWHIPAIVLTAALLIGMAAPATVQQRANRSNDQ
jgi:hypothetical protein